MAREAAAQRGHGTEVAAQMHPWHRGRSTWVALCPRVQQGWSSSLCAVDQRACPCLCIVAELAISADRTETPARDRGQVLRLKHSPRQEASGTAWDGRCRQCLVVLELRGA